MKTASHTRSLPQARAFALRFVLLAALWWLLTEGSWASWLIGFFAVTAASWVSLVYLPPLLLTAQVFNSAKPAVQPLQWLRFSLYFLLESGLAGFEVCRRALAPRLRLEPCLVHYPLQYLRSDSAITFFKNTINLLPGTLVIDESDGVLVIHLLNLDGFETAELRQCEQRIAKLFSTPNDDSKTLTTAGST